MNTRPVIAKRLHGGGLLLATYSFARLIGSAYQRSMSDSAAMHSYSADVRLWFIAGGVIFPLAQVGPGHIIFRDHVELDPCEGEVVIEVDGESDRWPIRLMESAVPFDSVRVRSLG